MTKRRDLGSPIKRKVKRRNLSGKPKREKFKKRRLSVSNKRNIKVPKSKRRIIEEVPDSWWVDRIMNVLKKHPHYGGGYLFDHGLFIFTKLTTYPVPKHIIRKMVDDRLIKKVRSIGKSFSYKVIIRKRKL